MPFIDPNNEWYKFVLENLESQEELEVLIKKTDQVVYNKLCQEKKNDSGVIEKFNAYGRDSEHLDRIMQYSTMYSPLVHICGGKHLLGNYENIYKQLQRSKHNVHTPILLHEAASPDIFRKIHQSSLVV